MGRGRIARYAAAAALVRLSDEGARVVLTFLAVDRGLGVQMGGLLVAALLVPHVVAAPLVGAAVDQSRRAERRVALLAMGFAAALAACALSTGRVPPAALLVVLLVGGCSGPALTGATSSLLPSLVSPAALPRAFGLDSLTYNVAGIAGPAGAAVLVGLTSAVTATLIVAGCAAVGALLVATLPIRPRAARAQNVRPGWLAGVRAVTGDRALGAVTGATSLGQVGAGALTVVASVAALRAGRAGEAGLLLGALALGGLVGSLLWTLRPARTDRAPVVVMIGLVAAGIPLILAGGATTLQARVALFALSGVANGPLFGALLLTRQERSPVELRSQVFTLGAGAKITAAALGAALAGGVTWLSVGGQLAAVGAIQVVAGAVGLLALGAARIAIRPLAQPRPRVPERGLRPG